MRRQSGFQGGSPFAELFGQGDPAAQGRFFAAIHARRLFFDRRQRTANARWRYRFFQARCPAQITAAPHDQSERDSWRAEGYPDRSYRRGNTRSLRAAAQATRLQHHQHRHNQSSCPGRTDTFPPEVDGCAAKHSNHNGAETDSRVLSPFRIIVKTISHRASRSPGHNFPEITRQKRAVLWDGAKPNDLRDEAFRRIILSIPAGKVSTYGKVAAAAGYPQYHRAVARLLRTEPPDRLPWHRVLGAGGEVKLPHEAGREQRSRLRMEGVEFHNKRVDMSRFEHQLRPWEVWD